MFNINHVTAVKMSNKKKKEKLMGRIPLFTFHSLLLFQLHYTIWSSALTQLPSGVWEQHALCVADHC